MGFPALLLLLGFLALLDWLDLLGAAPLPLLHHRDGILQNSLPKFLMVLVESVGGFVPQQS
jgi:hypothetical protein